MLRRHFARTACAALILASGTAAATAQEESVLRVVPYADLRNLDPVWTTAIITRHHAYMIYDTLFGYDADLVPQPQMVDTHTVSDDVMGLAGFRTSTRSF